MSDGVFPKVRILVPRGSSPCRPASRKAPSGDGPAPDGFVEHKSAMSNFPETLPRSLPLRAQDRLLLAHRRVQVGQL